MAYRADPFSTAWQGSFRDLANVVLHIRRMRLFGRLSLRNAERLSVVHLYFRAGKLVHVVGNRGDVRAILLELRLWTQGSVRLDRGTLTETGNNVNGEYERLLDEVLLFLGQRGIIIQSPQSVSFNAEEDNRAGGKPLVIDSELVITAEAKQLITPWEWRVLIEGTRRISLAVAHLVGPKEALNVLQDILDDCAAAFPAFLGLEIAPSGYLRVANDSQLDSMPREDVIEGFAALIAICQYFCSPIIGEREAYRLVVQSLREIGPMLVQLGVFRLDNRQFPDER